MTVPLQDVLEGKYEILEKIGEGGIGAVYKVRHRLLEEIRVIKVLRPESASKEDLRERFVHEARMAIRLKHPNIAQLHDFSIAEDDRAYIVMEFIDGVGLDVLLETSGPPSVDLAIEISSQALLALDYLHENDFVHRDVSPDNLMLTTSFDGSPLVKLIDLGIARHLGAEVRLTATGVFLGKARYCSPEQFSAGGETPTEVDRRGDLYSYGVMLYELLTGVYPFAGDNFAALAGSHLFHAPMEFNASDPQGKVPPGLRAAVLRALEKSPDDRFATAGEFAAALDAFRDPEVTLREEVDRTVEIATTTASRETDRDRPGSTQERLNAEFGMRKTSAADAEASAQLKGETVVAAPTRSLDERVRRIESLIARGHRRRATRALDRALAAHGLAPALVALRSKIERLDSAGGRRTWALAAALAGGAVLLIAAALALLWWLRAAPPESAATDPDAFHVVTVPETPLFDPSAGDGSPAIPGAAKLVPPPERPPPGAVGEPPPGSGLQPSGPGAQADRSPPPPGARDLPPAEPPPGPPPGLRPTLTQRVFEPGVGVVAPVLLNLPDPILPAGARELKDELTVVVRVLVDETGSVSRALIASGPSFRRNYRDAAIAAVEAARFTPARSGSSIGRMWTEVHVTFQPQ